MCTSPLRAFIVGTLPNGKKDLRIRSSDVDYLFTNKYFSDKFFNGYGSIHSNDITTDIKYESGLFVSSFDKYRYFTDYIEIPCGQCMACRLKKSREWANRIMLEAKYHNSNYFVTLTYNNANLPINYDDSNICPTGTLKKTDLQKFMKRLRINYKRAGFDNELRFFACGEYGETQRPHYHLIIFGLELPNKKPAPKLLLRGKKHNKHGDYNYYVDDLISKSWPFGFHIIGDVTLESAAYTARYVCKKFNGEMAKEEYTNKFREPVFCNMSRRPGLAKMYYDDNYHTLYEYDKLILNGKISNLPRYFDKLYDIDFPYDMATIKEMRSYFNDHLSYNKFLNQQITTYEINNNTNIKDNNIVNISLKRDKC